MASTDDTRFLLLLPPLPSVPDDQLLTSVYCDTIKQVLSEVALASQEIQPAPILDLALACPHLLRSNAADLSASFANYGATQSVIARLYRVVCIIAARGGVNIEDAAGVDVRVVPVAWERETVKGTPAGGRRECAFTTLEDLATSDREWQYAFGVEDDEGAAMVEAFVQAKQGTHTHGDHHEQQGEAHEHHHHQHNSQTDKRDTDSATDGEVVPCVAVGGTFDHLHIGHKLLLSMTIFAGLDAHSPSGRRSVIVGITGDALLKNKKYAEQLESWKQRQEAVYDFVRSLIDFTATDEAEPKSEERTWTEPNGHSVETLFSNGLLLRCVEIGDPFGPTITEEAVHALVLSAETRAGGKAINDKRAELGWKSLTVLEVDVLDADENLEKSATTTEQAQAFASKISSTEIRRKIATKATQPA